MALEVEARFGDFHAFGLEEFALQRGVRLADEDFAAVTDDAMPRDAFSRRGSRHGTASAASATAQAQDSGNGPVG